jgi:hypothetical protein
MTREALPIDISDMPDVTRLVEEARRTNTTLALRWGEEEVAKLSPVRSRRRRPGRRFVDTSDLPPVPYRTVDEMMATRPGYAGRAFTDDEITAALEEERARAWQRKSS